MLNWCLDHSGTLDRAKRRRTMRTSKLLVPLAAAAFVALVAPAAAAAQPYPAPPPSLTATPTTNTVGGVETVTGANFQPNEPVNITVTYTPTALGPRGAGALVPVAYAIPL